MHAHYDTWLAELQKKSRQHPFFVVILRLHLQRYSTNTKRQAIFHKKFLETLDLFFQPELSKAVRKKRE